MHNSTQKSLEEIVTYSNKGAHYSEEVEESCKPILRAMPNIEVTDSALLTFLSGTEREYKDSADIAIGLLKNKKYDSSIINALIKGNRHTTLQAHIEDRGRQAHNIKALCVKAIEQKSTPILEMFATKYADQFNFDDRINMYNACKSPKMKDGLKEEIRQHFNTADALTQMIKNTRQESPFRDLLQEVQKADNINSDWQLNKTKPAEASLRTYMHDMSLTRHFNFNAETVTIVTTKDKALSAETKFFSEFNGQAEIEAARHNLTLFHGTAPNSVEPEKSKLKISQKPIPVQNA